MECARRQRFTSDDTVIVMWSSIDRSDQWADGKWQCHGSQLNPNDTDYLSQISQLTGNTIRDFANIALTRTLLEHCQCKWYFLSMLPLDQLESFIPEDSNTLTTYREALLLYADDLKDIRPSIYSTVFNNDWFSRPGYFDSTEYNKLKSIFRAFDPEKYKVRTDTHPTPEEHLLYLDAVLPEISLTQKTRNWVRTMHQRHLREYFLEDWSTALPTSRF